MRSINRLTTLTEVELSITAAMVIVKMINAGMANTVWYANAAARDVTRSCLN